VNQNSPAAKQIFVKEEAATKELNTAVREQQDIYSRLLTVPNHGQIKLTSTNFEDALRKVAVLAQNHYSKVFKDEKWSSEKIQNFWRNQSLSENDWAGIARTHLSKVFGPEILSPLEETDTKLRIQVEAPQLGDFVKGLETGILPEQLASIRLESPSMGDPAASNHTSVPTVSATRMCETYLVNRELAHRGGTQIRLPRSPNDPQ
jgi:hypothetical protein